MRVVSICDLNVTRHTSGHAPHVQDFNHCTPLYEATVRGHSVCALLGGHWTIVQKACCGPSGKQGIPAARCAGERGNPGALRRNPPRATPPASPGQQSNLQAHGCTGHLRTVGCFGPCGGPQSFSRPREPRLSRQHGSARPHPRPGLVMQMPGVQSSSAALSRSPRGETARTPA